VIIDLEDGGSPGVGHDRRAAVALAFPRSPMVTAAVNVAAARANPPTFSAANQERRGSAAPLWVREGEGSALASENRRSRRAEIQLTAPSSSGPGAAFSKSFNSVSSVWQRAQPDT